MFFLQLLHARCVVARTYKRTCLARILGWARLVSLTSVNGGVWHMILDSFWHARFCVKPSIKCLYFFTAWSWFGDVLIKIDGLNFIWWCFDDCSDFFLVFEALSFEVFFRHVVDNLAAAVVIPDAKLLLVWWYIAFFRYLHAIKKRAKSLSYLTSTGIIILSGPGCAFPAPYKYRRFFLKRVVYFRKRSIFFLCTGR